MFRVRLKGSIASRRDLWGFRFWGFLPSGVSVWNSSGFGGWGVLKAFRCLHPKP